MKVQIFLAIKLLAWVLIFYLVWACKKDSEYKKESDTTVITKTTKPNIGKVIFEILDKNIYGTNAIENNKEIIVSVENDSGRLICNMELYKIKRTDSSYISDTLKLKLGDYKITRFFTSNGKSEIQLAAPLTGSEASSLVKSPLSIGFTLSAQSANICVKPEVVIISGKAPEYIGISRTFTFLKSIPFLRLTTVKIMSKLAPTLYCAMLIPTTFLPKN